MLQRLFRQFSGPEGPLGHVAGWLMVRKNQPANAWLVELLGAGPGDRVVEIGFGPGLAAERNVARGASVAGVDHSALMVRKASARLADAVREGRVDLRHGSVEALPFGDARFTRAMALNSLQFWPSAEAGLRELHRVLAPGGRLVLGQRLRKEGAGRFDRSRFGMTEERLAALEASLARVGFRGIEIARRTIADEAVAALVAARP
jgi:ubiquinone/menaquinone biosynthesis C-methylase UbiE